MPHTPTPSRRDVLAAGVGLLAAGGVAGARTNSARRGLGRSTRGKARNVVFLVTDGMSAGTFTLADMAIERRTGRGCAWASLWDRPDARRALMSTRSADSLVTDSAAGGSAWGCGRRINNGAINIHEGRELEPILVSAKKAGLATGLVSTARITHATPASFIANVPSRNMEDEIARQILDKGVDVALGGGARFMDADLVSSHPDTRLVHTAGELRAAAREPGRLVGVFSSSHMAYERDRTEREPSLAEMSMVAIERLDAADTGFVLQIEAGRVDHGGHANDIVASLHDQIAFDETIAAVTDWADERGDTLVIVTTDHGTGGPDLTVYNQQSLKGFDTLLDARHTLTWVLDHLDDRRLPDATDTLRALVAEHVGIELTESEADWVTRTFAGQRVNGFHGANTTVAALGAVMANHFGVAFTSVNHTAEHVDATAFGPGAEALPSRIRNNDLHALMTTALALPVG